MTKAEEFYKLANEYFLFISKTVITINSVPELMECLMKLYITAMNLPEIEPETIDSQSLNDLETVSVIIDKQISTIYWEVFDPYVQEEPVCGHILDDLSDIASDLLCGIKEYEAGNIGNAIFEWRVGLNSHWGKHIVDVLRALHTIRTQ